MLKALYINSSMFKWLRTAFHANKKRKELELKDIVRNEMAGVLTQLTAEQQIVVAQALVSVSDLPKELILNILKSAQPGVAVEFRFRDGSSMMIRDDKGSKAGPGW